mmetsp:Transcript_6974/g.10445  ORF Transcript_6974/g.10445 Transcript_6974/m.10445 type:complete len:104 (-) Transcript_6974:104-415(-)
MIFQIKHCSKHLAQNHFSIELSSGFAARLKLGVGCQGRSTYDFILCALNRFGEVGEMRAAWAVKQFLFIDDRHRITFVQGEDLRLSFLLFDVTKGKIQRLIFF